MARDAYYDDICVFIIRYTRQGLGIFLFTTASRTVLGPTQPTIQWVSGAVSLG